MPAKKQDEHPLADGPIAKDQLPKVDAGDSGATVGVPGGGAEAFAASQAAVAAVLDDGGKGYTGHNPDQAHNDSYGMAAQVAANALAAAEGASTAEATAGAAEGTQEA